VPEHRRNPNIVHCLVYETQSIFTGLPRKWPVTAFQGETDSADDVQVPQAAGAGRGIRFPVVSGVCHGG
jgi:hypothetical protein